VTLHPGGAGKHAGWCTCTRRAYFGSKLPQIDFDLHLGGRWQACWILHMASAWSGCCTWARPWPAWLLVKLRMVPQHHLQRKGERQAGQRLLPAAERAERAPALGVRPAHALVMPALLISSIKARAGSLLPTGCLSTTAQASSAMRPGPTTICLQATTAQ
jgi:hypothetical protein